MKAQFEVSEEVWGRVKVASMLACKSIGEMIEPVLSEAFPKSGPVDFKVGKVVLAPVKSTPTTSTPEKQVVSELKEGFGWCRVCGKNMVKLPNFLCPTCQKL